jgi:adenine phosphoribosyltransferase
MNPDHLEQIKKSIITVPDYPQPGVMFRDITSLLEDPKTFQLTIDVFAAYYKEKPIDKIVGTESRGFIFGAPLALALGLPFVLARKPGKLPRAVVAQNYDLEYGQDCLEIHQDAILEHDNVLVVDDLLATGGTVEAVVKLIRTLGGHVHHCAFVVSLPDLGGQKRLANMKVQTMHLCEFAGD